MVLLSVLFLTVIVFVVVYHLLLPSFIHYLSHSLSLFLVYCRLSNSAFPLTVDFETTRFLDYRNTCGCSGNVGMSLVPSRTRIPVSGMQTVSAPRLQESCGI